MEYTFYRDFYYLVEESIRDNTVTFLLGTRKCGKTVCLKQLTHNLVNTVYVDFKNISDLNDKYCVFDKVLDSIKNNDDRIFLLDEITYVPAAESKICEIACELAGRRDLRTKIVFTGSQSVALNAWASRAFAGNASKINVDFLTYSEFLRYKNLNEISVETYSMFLYETKDFYQFNSLEEYLKDCIEETIISNYNTSNYIYYNECELIHSKPEILVNIFYQALFTLHKHVNVQTFFKDNKLEGSISRYFRNVCNGLDKKVIADKIEHSFIGSYNSIKSQKIEVLKEAFVFLEKCGLITITPISNDMWCVPDIYNDFLSYKSEGNLKQELFRSFNLTINHPMFYVNILEDILREDMPQQLPNELLGSIVECHIRGLLPKGFEYHDYDKNDVEIDYVNIAESFAVKLTISNNHKQNFTILPEYYKYILLTKNINDKNGKIEKIDYCRYIYSLSIKRYQSKKIKHDENIYNDKNTSSIFDNVVNKIKDMSNIT